MNADQIHQLKKCIDEAVAECQGNVMFTAQLEAGDSPRWPYLRSRLLRAFGNKGLQGRINEIFGCPSAEERRS